MDDGAVQLMTAGDHAVPEPSEAEIRAALGRVVKSPNFRGSAQLKSFLRFVVEETLAGHADHIKGYSIAVGALGRSDTFDPQTDPIVRVQAGRLRRSLGDYYSGAGRDDEIVIALPRGSYVPTFCRRVVRSPWPRASYVGGMIRHAVQHRFRLVALVAFAAAVVSLAAEFTTALAGWAVGHGIATFGATIAMHYWIAAAALSVVTAVSIVAAWWISRI